MAETFLRIPRARVGVLVGTSGKTKEQLEKDLNCTVKVDTEGDVEIESADPLAAMRAKSIVQAIGRGFSPENAMMLLDESYLLDIINLQEVLGKSEKTLARYKARLIGTGGKVRKDIENVTETKIVIYGKTVSIIGPKSSIRAARKAISMILEGAPHGAVFVVLAKMRKRSW